MHDAVIPVEPEVEDDTVETDFEGEPGEVHGGGGLGGAVGEEDGEHGAEGRRGHERADDLCNANIGNSVAGVFITVEETMCMAQTAEDVEFVDGDGLEGDAVEDECAERADVVARILDVGVLQNDRDDGVGEDPAVHGPVGHVWYGVLLEMDGDVGIEMFGVNPQYFVEPVEERPLRAGLSPPRGLHRVLGVAFGTHGEYRLVSKSSSAILLFSFNRPKPSKFNLRGRGKAGGYLNPESTLESGVQATNLGSGHVDPFRPGLYSGPKSFRPGLGACESPL